MGYKQRSVEEVGSYLITVTDTLHKTISSPLVALYLHGSAVQGDFRSQTSDIDILGIVDDPLSETQRDALRAALSHQAMPVPAAGLEFVLCSAEATRTLPFDFPFEFALSTGPNWGEQYEPPDTASDIIVDLALCRQAGRVLHGPPASEVIAPISLQLLRKALVFELEWHREHLKDPRDTRIGENAVLNAARSGHAAKSGQIVSKNEGARLWLQEKPTDTLVEHAQALRNGEETCPLDASQVAQFLSKTIRHIVELDA